VPKGETALCIANSNGFAYVGSSSGAIFKISSTNGTREVYSKQADHAAPVVDLAWSAGNETLASIDRSGHMVLWDSSGNKCTSTDIVDSSSSLALVAVSGGFVAVGARIHFLGLNTQKPAAVQHLVYGAFTAGERITACIGCGPVLLFSTSRVILSVLLPALGDSSWSSEPTEYVMQAPVIAISAHTVGHRLLAVLAALEGGLLHSCQYDLIDNAWLKGSRSQVAPGSVLAIFHSHHKALGVFGTADAPTLSALDLKSVASATAIQSSARSVKRSRADAAGTAVSVASVLPRAKQSRGAVTDSVSLAERLAALSDAHTISTEQDTSEQSSMVELGTSSIAVPLSQALNSGNDALLERCLAGAASGHAIADTVQALSGGDALLLLNQLMVKFEKRPSRGAALLLWLKSTLQEHAGSLMTVPALSDRLLPLYQGVNQRMATFKKLLRLQGRLDLLLAHV
jgi:hypothetical protein